MCMFILIRIWLYKNVFKALGTKVQIEVNIRLSSIHLIKDSFHSGKKLPAGAPKIDIKSIYKYIFKLSWNAQEGCHDPICRQYNTFSDSPSEADNGEAYVS